MSLLFNMLSRLIITFLPRSKGILISWLQSSSAVILESQKIKSVTFSTVFPSICHEVMGPDAMILVFYMLSFKPTFSLSSFTFIKRLFSSSLLSAIRVVSSAYLRWLIFLPVIYMYSAYKLNKQGYNIQPWHAPFPILNQCSFAKFIIFQDHKPVVSEKLLEIHFIHNIVPPFLIILYIKAKIKSFFSKT